MIVASKKERASYYLFLIPAFASQWLFRFCLSALASCLSPSSQPGFPCFLSGSSVLGFLLVSFRPSQFRSRSRSTGASLLDFSSGINA